MGETNRLLTRNQTAGSTFHRQYFRIVRRIRKVRSELLDLADCSLAARTSAGPGIENPQLFAAAIFVLPSITAKILAKTRPPAQDSAHHMGRIIDDLLYFPDYLLGMRAAENRRGVAGKVSRGCVAMPAHAHEGNQEQAQTDGDVSQPALLSRASRRHEDFEPRSRGRSPGGDPPRVHQAGIMRPSGTFAAEDHLDRARRAEQRFRST